MGSAKLGYIYKLRSFTWEPKRRKRESESDSKSIMSSDVYVVKEERNQKRGCMVCTEGPKK